MILLTNDDCLALIDVNTVVLRVPTSQLGQANDLSYSRATIAKQTMI